MDHLRMHSADLTSRNIEQLAELFPTVVTESRDEHGEVKRAVDFDMLRQELSDHVVEGPQERYQLDWPGKREALFAANAPIAKTLRPQREESVDFDSTMNLFIEGDNLEALKLLQESYLGKVKLIYIDPPYNTGHDFVYNDSFAQTSAEYLERSGQIDASGAGLQSNSESNGRFHSDWLSMMYPRLKLARDFLTEDGVLLTSISDVEVANLRRLLDEVFGADNLIAQLIWANDGNVDQQSRIKGVHEYVIAYSKNESLIDRPTVIDPNIDEDSKLFREQIENSITKNGPKNPPSTIILPAGFPAGFECGTLGTQSDQFPHIIDPIEVRDGKLVRSARVRSGWSSKNLLDLFISNGMTPILDTEGRETRFELRETGAIYGLKKRSDTQGHVTSILRNMGTTKKNSSMLAKWGLNFSYPKPVFLIEYLIRVFTEGGSTDVIMDFFAGSGTTAHATLRANARDGGNRPYILIQTAEKTGDGDTVSRIARERIRASLQDVVTERSASIDRSGLDTGLRALRIDTTNMTDTFRTPDALDQGEIAGLIDNVKPGRTGEDLLFQVMLDWGLELSLSITRDEIDGREVFSVDDDALLACFAQEVTSDLVNALAARKPLRVVFRDSAFASDSARINAEQLFAEVSPSTDVKVI